MRAYLFGVAGFACAAIMAFAYLASPRTITETNNVQQPIPANATPEQIERALAKLKTIERGEQVGPNGQTYRCAVADSTGDPDDLNFAWYVEWCVQVGPVG